VLLAGGSLGSLARATYTTEQMLLQVELASRGALRLDRLEDLWIALAQHAWSLTELVGLTLVRSPG
jgi:hypothetical protein